ncbi:histidine kinase osmosensor [Mucor velutinosus]|uniref:Histidine kinase osmosensor n=1 Tax=Mucor velutinosus TaxID=708070 RepID=A0AAN7DSD6_9FUNG|nr:histidine kinase osmosensor [Mucor velutinosus]
MNENESGLKRPQESAHITANDEHKKQKTNSDDEPAAASSPQSPPQQQQQQDVPLLPATLILDKVQEETINDLVKNSNAVASLLQQSTDVADEQQKPTATTAESYNPTDTNVETEIPSADSTKAVTGTENEKVEDASASITSEQLLFALTSIPSSEKEAEEQQKKTKEDMEEQSVVAENADHDKSNAPPVPQPTVPSLPQASLPMSSLPPTGLGITPKTTQPPLETAPPSALPAEVPSDPVVGSIPLPSSTSNAPETVPTTTTAATAPVSSSALPPQTSLASTTASASNTSTIPSPYKSNINTTTTTTNPTLSSGASAAAAAAAVAASFSNFPEISAALRRLSTTNPSVIEQLSSSASSSSPRLSSNMGGHVGDRKGSSIDVSPHEIFGSALAAVAANAAAARSGPHSNTNNVASPKQPQQNTQSTTSNTAPLANNNAQATATAIGNLAAFTANISNLLHSGGFHRNSFSQEDTQKLAAVVANARNPQQRRKSSMQVVGNAFSSMIDQAYLMGRNKSFSEAAAAATINRSVPPSTSSTYLSSTTLPQTPPPVVPKPKLIIKNEQVWKSVEGMEEKLLGFQLYSPQLLLPNLEGSVNGLMEIRVPARFLTFENVKVKKRALWGTDIYTDDSDIVAMAIHSGKYQPHFIEPTIEPTDPFALAVAGKQKESIEAARRLALSGKKYTQHDQHWIPDHDLKVTVRVLPTLQSYASSIRHRLKSREWGKHDGMSLFVNKVEKIKRGDARLKGRGTLKSNMFAYESYRKQALGLYQDKKTIPTSSTASSSTSSSSFPPIQKGRIKKTRRVMRMFQIRSEMKKQA